MTRRRRLTDRLDHIALFVAQPAIAALAVTGLMSDSVAATEVSKPLFICGGVSLLVIIFAEGIWSFAVRHTRRERLVMLWAKLLGAGFCTILTFASAYKHLGLLDGGVVTHSAATGLYFSITSWTTAGFGDVVATNAARPFVAAQTLLGFAYNSALIGLMLFAMTSKASAGRANTKQGPD